MRRTITYRIRTVLPALLLTVGILCGCTVVEEQAPAQEDTDETIEIGMTIDSFLIERWTRDRDVFVTTAQDLGAAVNVQNANGEVEAQVEQIDYFINKDVDAIVIVQVANEGNEVLAEAIGRAGRAGIPVIAYDRLPVSADVDLYVSFDNEAVGRLMGEHIREHLAGEGTVIQVTGPLEDGNVTQIQNGFEDALSGSNIRIAMTEYASGWLSEAGFTYTGRFLNSGQSTDAVMCGNDGIAGQAYRALAERRLAGQVCLVGQDADLEACQRIVEGTQCMTVYKPIEQLARRAAELTVALAEGEEITVNNEVNDGTYDVPYESLDPIAVTRDNMDAVITGQYHERSDIYLNVEGVE